MCLILFQVFDDDLHKIVINESGINSLIIHATTRFDNGQYTCVAKNRAGEASFTVHLNVARKCLLFSIYCFDVSNCWLNSKRFGIILSADYLVSYIY